MKRLIVNLMQKLFRHLTFPHCDLPNFDVISVVNNIIDFEFKGGDKKYIDFSGNATFCCHKPKQLHCSFVPNYKRVCALRLVETFFKNYSWRL